MGTSNVIPSLNIKAQACLAEKTEISVSPLWNMALAAKYNSQSDLKYLQEALNYLTCKAREKMSFTAKEKEYLKEVEAFYWGGRYKGLEEAARLANHYVNGKGKSLKINSQVYQNSQ